MKTIEELTLPTQEAIVDRIKVRTPGDPFHFEVGELVNYLEFENAKPFLKPTATKEVWDEARKSFPHTKENVLNLMQDYYAFAWEKANNCRGLSAQRSLMHYFAWIFLLGDLEFMEEVIDHATDAYSFYGKPILERIGERYGWDWKKLDNGKRVNTDA